LKNFGGKNDDELVEEASQVIGELETITKELATRKSDIEFTLTNLAHYEEVIQKAAAFGGSTAHFRGV